MIKIEHEIFPSAEQMEFVIEGMRNPKNSWDRSDSGVKEFYVRRDPMDPNSWSRIEDPTEEDLEDEYVDILEDDEFEIGDNDFDLMKRLSAAGPVHRKFMRMMPVMVRITAPLYWWSEFDTYKVGTVANSCSKMHKLTDRDLTLDDFSHEKLKEPSLNILNETIDSLNTWRAMFNVNSNRDKKDYWWQMIQLLPSSYNQTRNVMLSYEVLANIYEYRKDHKLDEWRDFCKWIEEEVPYSELITGGCVTEIDKSIGDLVKQNDGYCPCAIEKTDDTKCMCKEFRESPKGTVCHCGRYLK